MKKRFQKVRQLVTQLHRWCSRDWNPGLPDSKPVHLDTAPSTIPYRLQLPVLEEPGQKATPQRHCEQQQEGKGERGRRGLDHPEQCNAAQLDASEQVHPPRLHLGNGQRVSPHSDPHLWRLSSPGPNFSSSSSCPSLAQEPLRPPPLHPIPPPPCFLDLPWSRRAAQDGVLLA